MTICVINHRIFHSVGDVKKCASGMQAGTHCGQYFTT